MNNMFTYLFELNVAILVLFTAYKLFFEKDKNFVVRRIYLLGVIVLPFVLLLMPETARVSMHRLAPVLINMEGITITGGGASHDTAGFLSFENVMIGIYLLILSLGLLKLIIQLGGIIHSVVRSEKFRMGNTTLFMNPSLHASSFFGYIFMDPASRDDLTFQHILEHEMIHKKEWHSIDRILAEIFVLINWFNPVAWLFRKSVIENLEYLADSAVLRRGTDPVKYQLSILNQYIGSASISNQFSNQIKNRINMLNKDYKLGSSWKLAMLFPLVFTAFLIVSCTEKDAALPGEDTSIEKSALKESKIYTQVDEMPAFRGEEPAEFRKFLAQNLTYPEEAKENGVSGKVIVTFIVSDEGKVRIPDISEIPPSLDGKEMGEVVVVSYRPLTEGGEVPDEKYIELLKKEALRVITLSPDWEPGKVDGKPVNVLFTFPITFTLQ